MKILKLSQPTGGNLPDNDVEARGNKKDERLVYAPYKFIPNVRKLRVEVSPEDQLFAKYDVKKRECKATLKIEKYENEHLNRYARHQLKRLKKADSKLY